jgi:hypothetical protein
LEDPSLLKAFNTVFKKSYKQPKQLWDKVLRVSKTAEVEEAWNTLVHMDILWPMDLDMYLASTLLDCTVLMIHRSKYGVSEGERGALSDLSLSSSLYAANYSPSHIQSKPIVMLYKDMKKESEYASYYAIVDAHDKFLYHTLAQCPKDVQLLVDYHLQHRKSPF